MKFDGDAFPDDPNESVDADGDGVGSNTDCDDADDSLLSIETDQDCDGHFSVDDCDDEDPNSTIIDDYADCDGVIDPLFSLAINGITVLCPNANVGDTEVVNGVTYTKQDRPGIEIHLMNNPPLVATSCTSGITDMSSLLSNKNNFNENIKHWDTSSVTDMSNMFYDADLFNQDIGSWDTSNVTNMSGMFSSTTGNSHFSIRI